MHRPRRRGRTTIRHVVVAIAVVVAASAVAAVTATTAAAQPRPVTLAQWQDDLAEAQRLARTAQAPDQGRMTSIHALSGPVVVEVHGATVLIPVDPVLLELDGTGPADFTAAQVRLGVLSREATALAGRNVAPRDVLASNLDDIYREVNPELTLRQRIERLLADLLSRIATSVAARPALALALLVLVAAAGIGLAVWVGRRSGLVGDARADADDPDLATDWLAEAERARATGDTDGAVRAAYRALVAALGERGVVDPRPSLTAAECRRSVRANAPDLAPAITDATDAYEQVVYAGRDANDDDIAALLSAHGAATDHRRRRIGARR